MRPGVNGTATACPAFLAACSTPDYASGNPDSPPNRFYAYGVVARLACLAAALELERTSANTGSEHDRES